MTGKEAAATADSQYVQQHFANERTFLAWVRTSITVAGAGFVAAGVVFRSERFEAFGQRVAAAIGIGSVLLGSMMLLLATRSYFVKRRGINESRFVASRFSIAGMFVCLAILHLLMLTLFALLGISPILH
ncbi:YidH family protein [Paenibacillus silvisoli]|uniref:YidH family protein n=1 Tax=Paenibacillus silvisoli TaxID=3110539 RepID=UPI002804C581|nr:DUF202 domain-containing protein [Paenibacillus silvisoli]